MTAGQDVAALVLAAGASRRFGSAKLAAPFRGEALVRHAIRAARAAPVRRVVVVCHPALDIGPWTEPGPPVERITLDSPSLGASLAAGLAAVDGAQAAFVFLGDMPLVPHGLAARLLAALPGHVAALPDVSGRPGHPVLLGAGLFPALRGLSADAGAGAVLRGRADVARLACAEPGAIFDIDHPRDLARAGARPG